MSPPKAVVVSAGDPAHRGDLPGRRFHFVAAKLGNPRIVCVRVAVLVDTTAQPLELHAVGDLAQDVRGPGPAFERGYVKLNLPAPLALNRAGTVEVFLDPGQGEAPRTVVPQLPWVHAMRQQAENFVKAIRGEIEPPCESVEALEDLKIAREYVRLLKGC